MSAPAAVYPRYRLTLPLGVPTPEQPADGGTEVDAIATARDRGAPTIIWREYDSRTPVAYVDLVGNVVYQAAAVKDRLRKWTG